MRSASVVVCLVLTVGVARAEEVRGTFRYDSVELIRGEKVEGSEEHAATHWRYRYLFANEQNKRIFEADPERYAVQMAGGCGRMGSLSGAGHPELFAVHDGKLYFFASDQCRKAFLASPERMQEVDDPQPDATPQAAQRGRELLDMAVAFVGGAAAIDAVRSYEKAVHHVREQDGKTSRNGHIRTVVFPDKLRHEQYWDEWRGVDVTAGNEGFMASSDKVDAMHPVQVRAHVKVFEHDLLYILHSRSRPEFKAAVTGAARIDDTPVELVTAWFSGSATTLAIDPQTGKVLRLSFRGRGPRFMFGNVEQKITEYREVGNLKLPVKWQGSFDGERVDALDETLDSVKINEPIGPEAFARPSRG